MTIIESVRAYLSRCPLLSGGKINVDFLPGDAATYSVDVTPTQPIMKQYLDGSSLRQFDFVVSTRTNYGADYRQQIDNLGFFEQLQEWIEHQSLKKQYPDLGAGRTVSTMQISTSGYIFDRSGEYARYQIQCKLTYYQKGER